MARLMLLFILVGGILPACRQEGPPAQAPTIDTPAPTAENTPKAASVATVPATAPAPTPKPSPTVTPTPIPPKDLVVCVSGEPDNLYLYGDQTAPAVAIRHALYESPYTSRNYAYQALALEKLPDLADGDANLKKVTVSEGDIIYSANQEVGPLIRGMEVIDADNNRVIFHGEPIRMNQLVVDFEFKPLVWSDGTPVTAKDSVFSYRLAADRAAPILDEQVRYTADYKAVDEHVVRWTGLPGYLDPAYVTRVWTPLPSHQLTGISMANILTADETARAPLSYGPFVVDSWVEGDSIRLVPNSYYYRSAEGLPRLDSLTFRFLSPGNTSLPKGHEGCNIITDDVFSFDALPDIDEAAAAGTLVEHTAAAGVVEQIVFGVDSAAAYEAKHVQWFRDARVRQAVTQCTDRQAIADRLTYGRAAVMDTFIPEDNPLHPDDAAQWTYDPAAANALLDEVGLTDDDGDGIRENINSTIPFTVTLGTNAGSDLRRQITEMVRDDLAECGIQAIPYTQEAGTWFAAGPGGTVFGRQFDLAQFAWLNRIQPDCGLYLTEHIPGPLIDGFNGWQGVNVSGWSNEAYDAACRTALSMLPGQPGYDEAHKEAMRIFAQELPAMPLFTRMRLAVTTPDVLNFALEPAQTSPLWNAFELDLEPGQK